MGRAWGVCRAPVPIMSGCVRASLPLLCGRDCVCVPLWAAWAVLVSVCDSHTHLPGVEEPAPGLSRKPQDRVGLMPAAAVLPSRFF